MGLGSERPQRELNNPEKPAPKFMSNNHRVLNITTGAHPKLSQAKKKVAECEWGWVEGRENEECYVLSPQESVSAWQKSEQKRQPVGMGSGEVPGVIYEPPKTSTFNYRLNRAHRVYAPSACTSANSPIRAANQYAQEATA